MTRTRLLMDVAPLRESPAFRRLLVGSALSQLGSQMTSFAVALQVFTLTHSSAAVGAVGLAIAIPVITLGLFGGTVVDAMDRRKVVLVCTSCGVGVSVLFAVQAFAGLDRVWPLYVLVAVQATVAAVNGPARRTFMPRLLPAAQVPSGAALTMFGMHIAVIGGPSLAGLATAAFGLKVCYVIDALSFGAALYGVGRLPAMPPQPGSPRPGLRALADSLGFIKRSKVLTGALLADMSATTLGMPVALLPAINAAHFGGAAQTLGLLAAAPSVGGVLGMALSGPVRHVSRQGRAMLLAGAVWGAGIAGFGLTRAFWLALLLLAVAGAADSISVVFRTTMIQLAAPDEQRGRVSAADFVIGVGCPQLGNFRAGVVGSLTTPAISAVSGGLATIVGAAVIGIALPGFSRYRAAKTDQSASV